jgi:hypothetical protein
MSGMGFQVRIVTGGLSTECGNAIEGKLDWIARMFKTKNWLQRVLITNDKTALRGNYKFVEIELQRGYFNRF